MHLVMGVLFNQDYGFSIRPVQNVSAYVTDGGDGNHGALFVLGRYRTITFSADYAGFVTGDDEPCNPSQLSWIPARIGKVMTTSVDGHPACVTDFEKGDRAWRVLQVRGNDRGTEIMYTLAMTTSEDFIQSDSRVFDLITKKYVGLV